MTPTTPIGAGAMPAPAYAPDTGSLASQNLFENAAHASSTSSQGLTPADVGTNILNNLDGPIERLQNFSKVDGLNAPSPQQAVDGAEHGQVVPNGAEAVESPGDSQFDRMIESIGSVFDHAIETQLVVRGATQISGSAQTVLRG